MSEQQKTRKRAAGRRHEARAAGLAAQAAAVSAGQIASFGPVSAMTLRARLALLRPAAKAHADGTDRP